MIINAVVINNVSQIHISKEINSKVTLIYVDTDERRNIAMFNKNHIEYNEEFGILSITGCKEDSVIYYRDAIVIIG